MFEYSRLLVDKSIWLIDQYKVFLRAWKVKCLMILDLVSHILKIVCKFSTISTLERRVRNDNMNFFYPYAVSECNNTSACCNAWLTWASWKLKHQFLAFLELCNYEYAYSLLHLARRIVNTLEQEWSFRGSKGFHNILWYRVLIHKLVQYLILGCVHMVLVVVFIFVALDQIKPLVHFWFLKGRFLRLK